MKFLERVILKLDPDFQKLSTKEKKRNYLTIFGHKHISLFLTGMYMQGIIPFFVSIFVLVVNLALLLTVKTKAISYTVFYLTMPIPTVHVIVMACIRYKFERKKQDATEIANWLWDKIQNFWLWNGRVISLKDWLYIRKKDKELYEWLRSDACNHKCYDATFQLAKKLSNPNIKILWIGLTDYSERYGHAVLEKNGRIYDSNHRRTYKKKKYLKAQEAEVFKEFPIEVYQKASDFTQLGWEEFGKWCQERGVIRNT